MTDKTDRTDKTGAPTSDANLVLVLHGSVVDGDIIAEADFSAQPKAKHSTGGDNGNRAWDGSAVSGERSP
jgi:hypothetical protein